MTRPNPVVRIRTKLTDGLRRSAYQTHIFICFYDVGIVFIPCKHRFYGNFLVRFYFELLSYFCYIFSDNCLCFSICKPFGAV